MQQGGAIAASIKQNSLLWKPYQAGETPSRVQPAIKGIIIIDDD